MKQILYELKAQPVISSVSIIGTALAIFLIMVVVMLQQVKVVPFAPESARDRMLHWRCMSVQEVGTDDSSNGPISYKAVEELMLSLDTPENVTAYSVNTETMSSNVPNERMHQYDVRQTDHRFFDVFDFKFINGAKYTDADFESGLPKAVITRSVARDLFGTTDAAGREFFLNTAPYTVVGVVEDVSTLADHAYGQIWIPFTSTGLQDNIWLYGTMGMLSATILARSSSDFDAIRDEIARVGEAFNSQMRSTYNHEIIWRNRPYTQEKDAVGKWANIEPDLEKDRKNRMIVFLILLIVPAINLSAMTQSRMRRRMEEIAVRRAYGASTWRIISSLLGENLVTTLIAGAIGLALCIVFAWLCGPMLFSTMTSSTIAPRVGMDVLLHWTTFAWAIGFCFVINLLCSGLPAWRASRQSIVNSLFGSTH